MTLSKTRVTWPQAGFFIHKIQKYRTFSIACASSGVSVYTHPSSIPPALALGVRSAPAHQHCPELLRGAQSLRDSFLPPVWMKPPPTASFPSYKTHDSVSLLQHKVHLSAHAAPPELLRGMAWGKVTFLLVKEIAFSETRKCQWHWEQVSYCHRSAVWRKNKKFSQQLCFTTLSGLDTCKVAAIN